MNFSYPTMVWKPLGVVVVAVALSVQAAIPAQAMPVNFARAIPPVTDTGHFSQKGLRIAATRVPVNISDLVSGSVDVGTGNVNLSIQALGFSFAKNSLDSVEAGQGVRDGWRVSTGGAGTLSTLDGKIVWTTGDGYELPFTPAPQSTTVYQSQPEFGEDAVWVGYASVGFEHGDFV